MRTRKKGKTMKVILIILGVILLAGAAFLLYKMNQLKKLQAMSVEDIIAYDTEDSDVIISAAIIQNGEISYKVYGGDKEHLNTDNDYEIGSISKTFVGLMFAKAIAEGKINPEASISEYLDLDKEQYYPTINRLLTHTSGYKGYYLEGQMVTNRLHGENDFYKVTREDILERVKKVRLSNQDYPFEYSNFGLSVAALVLEKVYGKDFTGLMNDFITEELNLHHTKVAVCDGNLGNYWKWQKNDGYIPAGAIISNIEDMAAYLQMYMTSEKNDVKQMYQPLKQVKVSNSFYDSMDIHIDEVGITWMLDNKNHYIWHNGGTGNYNSYMAFQKESQTGIVLLSNLSPDKKIPMTVLGIRIMNELTQE